jgi:hypothetical protein
VREEYFAAAGKELSPRELVACVERGQWPGRDRSGGELNDRLRMSRTSPAPGAWDRCVWNPHGRQWKKGRIWKRRAERIGEIRLKTDVSHFVNCVCRLCISAVESASAMAPVRLDIMCKMPFSFPRFHLICCKLITSSLAGSVAPNHNGDFQFLDTHEFVCVNHL